VDAVDAMSISDAQAALKKAKVKGVSGLRLSALHAVLKVMCAVLYVVHVD
jgi:hypothetical protein